MPHDSHWGNPLFPIWYSIEVIKTNFKFVVRMSEWSQMIELDIVKNSETPNLATLYRLASTWPSNFINCGKWQLFWQFMGLSGPAQAKRWRVAKFGVSLLLILISSVSWDNSDNCDAICWLHEFACNADSCKNACSPPRRDWKKKSGVSGDPMEHNASGKPLLMLTSLKKRKVTSLHSKEH